MSRFDFADPNRRASWSRLRDDSGREVVVTEYPTSLVQMLLADVLTGTARQEAEALREALDPAERARLERLAAANRQ